MSDSPNHRREDEEQHSEAETRSDHNDDDRDMGDDDRERERDRQWRGDSEHREPDDAVTRQDNGNAGSEETKVDERPTYNVFVGNLAKEVTEEDLREKFKECGEIFSVTVIQDHKVKDREKCYAFVHFTEESARQQCLTKFASFEFKGRTTRTFTSDSKNVLFVGGIPPKPETEKLKEQLEDLSGEKVLDLNVKTGFCFVTFVNYKVAERAMLKLSHAIIEGRKLTAELAKTKPIRTNEAADREREEHQQRTLYVRNIGPDTDEQQFREHFNKHGKVRDIRFVKEASGKNKGFAFVEYDSNVEARQAVKALHETEFDGRTLHVEFQRPKAAPMRGNERGGGGYGGGYGGGGYSGPRGGRDRDSGSRGAPPPPLNIYADRSGPLLDLPPRGGGGYGGRGGYDAPRGGRSDPYDQPPRRSGRDMPLPHEVPTMAWDERTGQYVLLTPAQQRQFQEQMLGYRGGAGAGGPGYRGGYERGAPSRGGYPPEPAYRDRYEGGGGAGRRDDRYGGAPAGRYGEREDRYAAAAAPPSRDRYAERGAERYEERDRRGPVAVPSRRLDRSPEPRLPAYASMARRDRDDRRRSRSRSRDRSPLRKPMSRGASPRRYADVAPGFQTTDYRGGRERERGGDRGARYNY